MLPIITREELEKDIAIARGLSGAFSYQFITSRDIDNPDCPQFTIAFVIVERSGAYYLFSAKAKCNNALDKFDQHIGKDIATQRLLNSLRMYKQRGYPELKTFSINTSSIVVLNSVPDTYTRAFNPYVQSVLTLSERLKITKAQAQVEVKLSKERYGFLLKNEVAVQTAHEVSYKRYGKYDVDIEVWQGGQWIPSWLSRVEPNQFFQILSNTSMPGKCFVCRSPIKIIHTDDKLNPNVTLQGLEIVTAPAQYPIKTINAQNIVAFLDVDNPVIVYLP